MQHASLILLGTAATLGVGHTVMGIDHSLPFVVLARAERWSFRKLLAVTAGCGLAHVLSSVLIGVIGIGVGVSLDQLAWIEAARGGFAAWLLIGLGLAYMVWGVYRARRGQDHRHSHAHADGTVHVHDHNHRGEHVHVHQAKGVKTLSMIGLFLVFVFGPCEVLIPMLLAPAFERDWLTVAGVVGVFGFATIATMLCLVTAGYFGLAQRRFAGLERYVHAASGFAIAMSGLAIRLLGV